MPKPVQNDLAKFNDLMDENRRLRGEVRRLRRVARKVASELRKSVFSMDQALAGMLEAALAPRRRKK